jgi:hypothetical protein
MEFQMAQLAVDGDEESRPDHIDQQLHLLPAGVAGDMNIGDLVIKNGAPRR